MSKSKRMAQGTKAAPAPRQKRGIWTGDTGRLRTGWLLAISLGSYAVLALGLRLALTRAFVLLFNTWGVVDAASARLSPVWAQLVYAGYDGLITLAIVGTTLVLCRWLRMLWDMAEKRPKSNIRSLFWAALAGLAGAVLIAALGLVCDSLRPLWPLSAPRLSFHGGLVCAVSLAAVLAEECFGKRVIYDGMKSRLGTGGSTAIATVVFFVANGGYRGTVISAINVLLLGLFSCQLYAALGLGGSVGFGWGWTFANSVLLGFGGGEAAVYRFFGISEVLMTGGDAGPIYGLWTTLALSGAIAALWAREKGRSKG